MGWGKTFDDLIRRKNENFNWSGKKVPTETPSGSRKLRAKVRRKEDKQLIEMKESQQARDRALLLYHSLVAANYQNRVEKVGIRQFINRLQMLLQEPLVIVLLSKLKGPFKGKSRYLVLYHTMHDPLWKNNFESVLTSEQIGASVKANNLIISSEKCGDGVYKIHDNKYVMFFKADFSDCSASKPPIFELIIRSDSKSKNSNSGSSKMVKGCIDPVLHEFLKKFRTELDADEINGLSSDDLKKIYYNNDTDQTLISENLNRELDSRSSSDYWYKGSLIAQESRTDLTYNFGLSSFSDDLLKDIYDSAFEKISSVFDDAYEKIRDSYLLKYNNFQPPNIMFAVRFFENKRKRFKGFKNSDQKYCYGVRGLIPKRQKEDISTALEILNDIQSDKKFAKFKKSKDKNVFYFPKPSDRNKEYDQLLETDFPQSGNGTYGGADDSFFWEGIKTEQGREKIINELESPYSLCARSLSDIVFSGGFVRVAPEPYVKTNGIRLDYDVMMNGSKEVDYRRTVYYHYLMSMAARAGGSVSALIVPGYVNGSPWFSMGYYFTSAEDDSERWINCYHFYHSVAQYFIRGIRSRIKRLFLDELKRVYINLADPEEGQLSYEYPDFPTNRYPEMINPHFQLLCRIYPFERAELIFVENANDLNLDEVFELKGHYFRVRLHDNPYFQKNSSAKHLEEFEVVRKLKEAIL